MPKVSGNDLISGLTEKYGRRLLATSFIAILIKAYGIDLEELSVFGLSLPPELFDVVAVSLIAYFTYALLLNWIGDLAAFRLWFENNDIRSELGTSLNTDKEYISGGIGLIKKLYALEKGQDWPERFDDLDSNLKEDFHDFKTNLELYNARLQSAGRNFCSISVVGHIYIWFQSFGLPVGIALIALYFILCGEPMTEVGGSESQL